MEIKVGDKVTRKNGKTYTVVSVFNNTVFLVNENGRRSVTEAENLKLV